MSFFFYPQNVELHKFKLLHVSMCIFSREILQFFLSYQMKQTVMKTDLCSSTLTRKSNFQLYCFCELQNKQTHLQTWLLCPWLLGVLWKPTVYTGIWAIFLEGIFIWRSRRGITVSQSLEKRKKLHNKMLSQIIHRLSTDNCQISSILSMNHAHKATENLKRIHTFQQNTNKPRHKTHHKK